MGLVALGVDVGAFAVFMSQLNIGIVVLASQGQAKQWSPEEIGFAVVDWWFNQALTGRLAEDQWERHIAWWL
jgi:hypothetical protein